MNAIDTARAIIAAGDEGAVARLVEALDAVTRKYGMFGDGWFVLPANDPVQIGRDLLATLPTAKEG